MNAISGQACPVIYLDYMSTTPVDPQVASVMAGYLTLDGVFGNPSSAHAFGEKAAAAVMRAREQVAALINAQPREIVWTSGATEANNLALMGAARFYQRSGKHIITCKTEHKAVLDTCHALEREGFVVTYLTPQRNGLLDLDDLKRTIREDTIIVSIMHANNEIGVIQDIQAIGELTRRRGIIFHVDAAQSVGKVAVDVQTLEVDLMALASHKVYGPKGIGALYVRRKPRVRLQPLSFGGGHEMGLRSGTLPTHQIVGMGEAYALAKQQWVVESAKLLALRQRFLRGIASLPGVYINGDLQRRLPGNLNVSIQGVEGESLLLALRLVGLVVSTASACTASQLEPSYVLRALGVPAALAHSSVRLSFGRFTQEQEVDRAAVGFCQQVERLRVLAAGLIEKRV